MFVVTGDGRRVYSCIRERSRRGIEGDGSSTIVLTNRSQAGKFSKIFARCARRQIFIQIFENIDLPQIDRNSYGRAQIEIDSLVYIIRLYVRHVHRTTSTV